MESLSCKESSHRNWLELPRDVTLSIMSRVEDIDVLRNVQFVCSSWLKICRDPLLWRTIDLRAVWTPDFRFDFERICRRAVDYSSGQLVEINIGDFPTDRLLQYITNSSFLDNIFNKSSQIKCLRLFRCFQISDGGLSAVAAKLPLLEELELSNGSLRKESLEAFGQQCPHLKSLKFNFQGEGHINFITRPVTPNDEAVSNEHAIAIAKSFTGLRNLELVGNEMTDVGLQAVLDGCPHLESLDLRCCYNIEMQGNLQKTCEERIKSLLLPNDGTFNLVEEARQARVRASDSQRVEIPVENNLFGLPFESDDNKYGEDDDGNEYSEDEEEDKDSEYDNNEDAEDDEEDEYSEEEVNGYSEDEELDKDSKFDNNEDAEEDEEDEYFEDGSNADAEDDDGSESSEFEGNRDECTEGNDNEYSEGAGDEYAESDEDDHSEPEYHNTEYAIDNGNEYSQFDDDCYEGFVDDFAELSRGGGYCDYDNFSSRDDCW